MDHQESQAKNTILLVDDDHSSRFAICSYLQAHQFEVRQCDTFRSGLDIFRSFQPDATVIEYRLQDGQALDALPKFREIDPSSPILLWSRHGSIDIAVRAMQLGADHFLIKPISPAALLAAIHRSILGRKKRARRVSDASHRLGGFNPFLGNSPAMRAIEEKAERLRDANTSIVIYGETGTGKGVLARWLHATGLRSEQRLVEINCATLSAELLATELFGHARGAFTSAVQTKTGLLEEANRGTLFLDEIGDMGLHVQSMLLKVIEERRFRRLGETKDREVDIRLIAATHQDLGCLVRQKRFRGDLFYRINTVSVQIPPLRDRQADIEVLAEDILSRLASRGARFRLSHPAMHSLRNHFWPGNIRELRNVLERAALFASGDAILPEHIQFDLIHAADRAYPGPTAGHDRRETDLTLEEVKEKHIARILIEERGNVERAARRLGVPRSSLYAQIRGGRIRVTPQDQSRESDTA